MTSTLYYGGPILTMVSPTPAQALLVNEGIIQAVGPREELEALDPDARRIDLQGCTLMPAFLDSHSHITALAQTFALAPLENARSFQDIHRLLKDFAQQIQAKPEEWITGFGYDHNFLQEGRHPSRQLLDQWFPSNPVLLSHASGHMGVVNSRALQAMGLTSDSPDPEGGLLGRDKDTGELNGYLEETAFTVHAGRAVPRPSRHQLLRQLKMAEQVYLSHGITTIQDGLTRTPQWELLLEASQESVFQADIVAYADLKECPRLLREYPVHAEGYDHHLRLGGYKIFLDGSPQGRTAWMRQPYLGGEPDYRGYPIYGDGQVADFFLTAYEEGRQLLVHCNGDAAAEQMIRACQEVIGKRNSQGLPIPDIRPVMIHAQLAAPDQFPAMAACSMIASFFPAHIYHWGDIHLKNFGQPRASQISAAGSALSCGLAFTFHQDTPVLPPNMLETLWCAVNRLTREGVSLDPGQAISPLEGLKAMTRTAAYQYHEENRKGSLAPGMLADLVILSDNPLTVPAEELRRLEVLATLKEDVPVYQREKDLFFSS
ncbi:MAG TPA: amidohydrolase [Candidatus Egerieimonas intestinavium]|uniref:Amidohydrolase n=1 Tax=Candidatus Egerieimonas intestinavium TaxID=2840777 RepID=A0A9D1JF64_9FIRM|nr:amidohydrolase [Candidatus Egerieimonas intestinavium]